MCGVAQALRKPESGKPSRAPGGRSRGLSEGAWLEWVWRRGSGCREKNGSRITPGVFFLTQVPFVISMSSAEPFTYIIYFSIIL